MNWCILIPALVGLICGILGYLLGRLFGSTNNNDDECKKTVERLKAEIALLKEQLAACHEDKISLEAKRSTGDLGIASSFAAPVAVIFDESAAKAVFGKKIKKDDLTVVEGIGPKIKELFHNHDISTWKALSETSVDDCQKVLNTGGERYKIHKPGTWPKQAQLAYEGKWQELFDWQEKLDGGK